MLVSPARRRSSRTVSPGTTRNLMSANVRKRPYWAASVRASRVDRLAGNQEVERECGCQVAQTFGILENLGTPIPRFSSFYAHRIDRWLRHDAFLRLGGETDWFMWCASARVYAYK